MWFDYVIVASGAFFAALVIGSAGFAFAIVVTGVWIYVLPPAAIVLLASICATLLHVASIWQFRSEIEYRRLWPFLAGSIIGVPLGVLALQHINAAIFRHLFGAFMIAYSTYMLTSPRLARVNIAGRQAQAADAAVGWVGGILGGLAMLHGTLPTLWCGLRGWDKRTSRLVYQPYIGFTAILVMVMTGLHTDVGTAQIGWYLLACLPALAAGYWLGIRIFDWISEERFRKFILWLILASGISLQF
ncbi:MAG: sulfite exporter TauE/SafE family protein [Burkholderiales bacterium]